MEEEKKQETKKKKRGFFRRATLWLLALVLLLVVVVQLGLWGGVFWLNTGSGNQWVRSQIAGGLEHTPYQIEFARFNYGFLTTAGVEDLKISDAAGIFFTASRARIDIGLFPLAARRTSLSIKADEAELVRLPRGGEEEPAQEERGFALPVFEIPDLYFTSFVLNDLRVKNLKLGEAVTGMPLTVSSEIEAAVTVDGGLIEAKLDMRVAQSGQNILFWLPGRIKTALTLSPSTSKLKISSFDVSGGFYKIQAGGEAVLQPDGMLDLIAKGQMRDISRFVPDETGSLELAAKVTGTQAGPLVRAIAKLHSASLEKRGLKEMDLAVSAENIYQNPEGILKLDGVYQDKPVNINAAYLYEAPRVKLQEIEAVAPEIMVSGALELNTDTTIVSGEITADIKDLAPYQGFLKRDVGGGGKVTARLYEQEGAQAADVEADLTNPRYQDLQAGGLALSTTLPDVKNPWLGETRATLENFKTADLSLDTLRAVITPEEGKDFKLSLDGEGYYLRPLNLKASADLKSVTEDTRRAENISAVLAIQGNALEISGMADMRQIDMMMNANSFPLSVFEDAMPGMMARLTVSGQAALKGPLDKPVANADIVFSPVTVVRDGPQVRINLKAHYSEGYLRADLAGSGEGIETLNGSAALPLQFSLAPFVFELQDTATLSGSLQARMNMQPLSAAVLPPVHILTGDMNASASLSGTLAAPDYAGTFALADGFYAYEKYGIELVNLDMNGRFSGDSLVLENVSATDGAEGTITGRGRVDLSGDKAASDVQLRAENMHLLKGNIADGLLSARLKLEGNGRHYLLSGEMTPQNIDINIPERFREDIPELNIIEDTKEPVTKDNLAARMELDMRFTAPNQVFVRGWGLDTELGGNLDITGTLESPLVNGTLNVLRGRFEEFGTGFRIDRASLRFQGAVPPSPYLDVLAETQAEDITAQIFLTGSVEKPSIRLSSVPSLPEDEVLSYVMFGDNMSSISPFQAVQIAQTLRRFSGEGGSGFDPLGQLRNATGFDDLRVETDAEGGASVGVGKYLTDKVYLELEKGTGEQGGAANLEIELTPSISLESEVGQDARAGAGVFWEWDY